MYYCKNCGNKFHEPIEIYEYYFGACDACPRCKISGYLEEIIEEDEESEDDE